MTPVERRCDLAKLAFGLMAAGFLAWVILVALT